MIELAHGMRLRRLTLDNSRIVGENSFMKQREREMTS